ncbi:nuclear pore protein seh1 [Coprinopsis marcescibilis]|uniref:Nuclear pore protein seh1 n=1 Tax=Coprinopsis marcescibilis TaxID=230819 RepID=A0A5C3KKF2_COPMA|nr:nuclear pore protein seh1 [Coprinopsis marcescibilis]
MIQTGLIPNAHSDLVTDAAYDFYGLRLATCGLDQRIKVWHLDEANGAWNVEDDWKAHDATISKLSWAHPEFGSILASASFDRTVKVWEQAAPGLNDQQNGHNGSSSGPSSSRWVERAVLMDARGTVRAVEFAPHHFGLKLATISSDNVLRIYECLEQPTLSSWQLLEEIDVANVAPGPSPAHVSRVQTLALATPTQTNVALDAPHASLVAQALQQSLPPSRHALANREADGGWTLSWCKDRYWGEIIAVGAGTSGVVKIIQLNSRRSNVLLALEPSTSSGGATGGLHQSGGAHSSAAGGAGAGEQNSQQMFAVTSVSWAPSCGRSYHLVATGSRDGKVRVWKLKPPPEEMGEEDGQDDARWTANAVADFDHHKSAVGRVEWNVTGTVLSSAGNDGKVRLWKATVGNVWRTAGSIGVEQASEESKNDSKDVEMGN